MHKSLGVRLSAPNRLSMESSMYTKNRVEYHVVLLKLCSAVRYRVFRPRYFFACLPVGSQGVGVSRPPLPASLFEHMSMHHALNPPTQRTHTHYAPLWLRDHCMCVIAERLGGLHGSSRAAALFSICSDNSPLLKLPIVSSPGMLLSLK